jgi:hypothetical protein
MTAANEGCRLIGAILPRGVAPEVLRRLRDEKGIVRAAFAGARGLDQLLRFAPRSAGEETAVDVLRAIVPAERADEVFVFVFEAAGVDRPDGGIVFQHLLSGATPYDLPELPEESQGLRR